MRRQRWATGRHYWLITFVIAFMVTMSTVGQTEDLVLQSSHTSSVWSAAFSHDGRLATTAGRDGIRLWDVASGKLLRHIDIWNRFIAFFPDGSAALIIGEGRAAIWDLTTGLERHSFRLPYTESGSLAISPDGQTLLVSSNPPMLLSLANGKELRTFYGNYGTVSSVAFLRNGQGFLFGTTKGEVLLFDMSDRETARRFAVQQTTKDIGSEGSKITSIATSPDGKKIVASTMNGVAVIFDSGTGQELCRLEGHSGAIASTTFAPDGLSVATASQDGSIRVWGANPRWQIGRLWGTIENCDEINKFDVNGHAVAAYSPDSKSILIASTGGIRLISTESGGEIRRFGTSYLSTIAIIAFSRDGNLLAAAGSDNSIKMWDISSRKMIRHFTGHDKKITSISISSSSSLLVSASIDGNILLLDTSTGRQVQKTKGPAYGRGGSVSFLPDERAVLITSGTRDPWIWRFSTDEKRSIPIERGDDPEYASTDSGIVSPDGKFFLIIRSFGQSRLIDSATGTELHRFKKEIQEAAFSSDGSTLLVSYRDHSVLLLDAMNGTEIKYFDSYTRGVRSVALSATDNRVIALTYDGQARIYTTPHKKDFVLNGAYHAATFSPDGKTIATAGSNGIQLWEAFSGKHLATLYGIGDEWLSMRPDGYFIGSYGAERFLSLVDGASLLPEWGVSKYRRTDLTKGNNSPLGIDVLQWLETTTDRVRLAGRITGSRDGLVLTAADRRLSVAPDGAFTIEFAGLIPGEQSIDIVAETADEQRISTTVTVVRRDPEVVIPPQPHLRRFAVIITNSNYDNQAWSSLPNSQRDGDEIAAAFKSYGFEIIRIDNKDRYKLNNDIANLSVKLKKETKSIFTVVYYSGHGTSINDHDYIVPIGADQPHEMEMDQADAQYLRINEILRLLNAPHQRALMVIDACRNDASPDRPNAGSRLSGEEPRTGNGAIIYATVPRRIASAGPENGLSPFTAVFVRHLKLGPTTLGRVVRATAEEVKKDFEQPAFQAGDLTILEDIPLRRQ